MNHLDALPDPELLVCGNRMQNPALWRNLEEIPSFLRVFLLEMSQRGKMAPYIPIGRNYFSYLNQY